VLEHDRYYRDHPELRLEDRAALNYDHPNSLETDLLVEHLRMLRAGQPIDAPVYDFARHTRQPVTETVRPLTAIIVEGILIFADPPLRALMDVKVFVDTDADTRFIRRLKRDINDRGRSIPYCGDRPLRYGPAGPVDLCQHLPIEPAPQFDIHRGDDDLVGGDRPFL